MGRAALIVAGCMIVIFAAAATRAVWAGGAALDDGDAALRRGDTAEAIASWRRAARWYVPVVGRSADAFARLERLARDAETRGDTATALAAWDAERGAALAIRGAGAPFDDRRRSADARLAALRAAQPSGATAAGTPPTPPTLEERTAWHARILAGAARPTRAWLLLAALGLAALAAGGGLSLSTTAAHRRRAALVLALGAAAWLTGITLA